MNKEEVRTHKLDNGMTLVAECMAEVSSAAFGFLVPAGVACDPDNRTGTATVLAELVFRGAGVLDNRTLNEQLDSLGLHRHGGVSTFHSCFSGALLGDNLLGALAIHADILQRPHLNDHDFLTCKDLAIQSLQSLEDDPRSKISLLVHEQFFSYPFGRPAPGKENELQQLTCAETKAHWSSRFTPQGTILALAGKFDFGLVTEAVEKYFGNWQGSAPLELPDIGCKSKTFHEANDGAQVHIGLMYPSVHYSSSDYYNALTAVSVLSGGMGSRLFTEVREKRGLCYAVGAGHRVVGRQGAVFCYAGSSPDNAQEALDVMTGELVKLADGISQDELDRAKVGLRSSLIMQGESTSARAGSCAGDYYHLGRVRSLEEIEQAINAVTVDGVVDFVGRYRPKDFAVATIGPRELKIDKTNSKKK